MWRDDREIRSEEFRSELFYARFVRMNLICVTFECRSSKVPLILFNDKKLGRDWRSWIFFFERTKARKCEEDGNDNS